LSAIKIQGQDSDKPGHFPKEAIPMPDQPISGLTLIGPPASGYSPNFTTNNPTGGAGRGGAQIEILDTTNTTLASTGTNSRMFPGDMITGYTGAGTGITITAASTGSNGIVTIAGKTFVASGASHAPGDVPDPGSSAGTTHYLREDATWAVPPVGGLTVGNAIVGGSNHATLVEDGSGNLAALAIGTTGNVLTVSSGAPTWVAPVTASYHFSLLSTVYNPTGTMANVGLSLTLSAGTWLISGIVNSGFNIYGTQSGSHYPEALILAQLYDTTNSIVVPGGYGIVSFLAIPVTISSSAPVGCYLAAPLGPTIYTVAGSTTINLQAQSVTAYGATIVNPVIETDSVDQASTSIVAVRIA
jgi:hypothetical protein